MKLPSPQAWVDSLNNMLASVPGSCGPGDLSMFNDSVVQVGAHGVQALALLFACRDALEGPIGRDARKVLLHRIDSVLDCYEE